MRGKLSVLILAKNEEQFIGDCIKSVQFADEIIVIDDFSDDNTKAAAESLGAKVIQHELAGDWGAQRTFAVGQAKNDWIYFLDADERVSKPLAVEIQAAVAKGEKCAYSNARLSYYWEVPLAHGGWYPDYCLRLLPKEGTYSTGMVHEEIHHPYSEKRFPEKARLIHYPYRSWEHYFSKFNTYTTLGAKKLFEKGRKGSFTDIVFHPIGAFLKMYVFKAGWREGKIGFILACFHFAYTMAKYVKLYYMDKTNGHVGDEIC